MKLKLLFLTTLFFYVLKSDAQDKSKLDVETNSVAGGCLWSYIYYKVIPDTVWHHADTVDISSNDSVLFAVDWDGISCPPIEYNVWFRNGIQFDSVNFFSGGVVKAVTQTGNYYARMGISVGVSPLTMNSPHIIIVNTNTLAAISEQKKVDFNLTTAENMITISNLEETNSILLSIHDLTGRIIFRKEIMNPSSLIQIEVPSFSRGLYILHLTNKNINFSKKFYW